MKSLCSAYCSTLPLHCYYFHFIYLIMYLFIYFSFVVVDCGAYPAMFRSCSGSVLRSDSWLCLGHYLGLQGFEPGSL